MNTTPTQETYASQEHPHPILSCTSAGNDMEARVFYEKILGLHEIAGEHPDHTLWFEIEDFPLMHSEAEAAEQWFSEVKLYLESLGIIVCSLPDELAHDHLIFLDQFGNTIELIEA